ncbi:MAG: hypothetical protein R6V45_06805 [Oceanipulchritudo sp.]
MLFKNPILIRFCRSELRLRKSIFWYLLTLVVSAFSVAIIYVPQVVRGQDPVEAARSALLPLIIIQGVILLFMGTGSVASGITREKVDKVLDYQRLTPLPVHRKIIGYLFGLPVREYVLFLITLPFAGFILLVGNIPPSAFVPYYLVLLSSTLLYHLTGMVAGMVSRRWRWSARISQGLILLLYFVLPQLSHLGLVFLEFLTVRPVFAEHILPVIGPSGMTRMETGSPPGQSVPVFAAMVSGTLFSLAIQILLISLFTWILARKWRADSVPAISKPMAASTFLIFSTICLANLWPNLTRSSNALNILQSGGDLPQKAAIFMLPLILSLVTTALALILMVSALPDPMQYRHGRIRASHARRGRLSLWDDCAPGYLLSAVFIFIQALLLLVALTTVFKAGYFTGLTSTPLDGAVLVLSGILVIIYFQGLKETFGSGQLGLVVLLHWMIPILLAIIVMSIDQGLGSPALLLAAVSPLTLIPLSATLLLPPEQLGEHLLPVHRALALGLLLLGLVAAGLHGRLLALRRRSAPATLTTD